MVGTGCGARAAALVRWLLLVSVLATLAMGATGVLAVSVDSDGDGLADHRETALGTDPSDADTDGDRLPDGWEARGETPDGVALPDSDPLHKDLYVQVEYGASIPALSADERAVLRARFGSMPVDNPDGERGIDLHLDDRPDDRRDRLVLVDRDGHRRGSAEFYTDDHMGDRRCVYALVLLGQIHAGLDGYATAPGYFVAVDGTEDGPDPIAAGTERVAVLTHELLHTIVGTVPGGGTHTERGWLASPHGDATSETTAEVLSERGFASSHCRD